MKEYGMDRREHQDYVYIDIPRDELYQLYVEEGLDGTAIAALYGCAVSSVYNRMKEHGIPTRPMGWDKSRVMVAPERLEWSADFAYVVGLITADGDLRKRGNEVKFSSTDRDLIDTYCRLLGLRPDDVAAAEWPDPTATQVHLLYEEKPYGNKSIYRIAFSDPAYRARLESIGLAPAKSNVLDPLAIPDAYFRDFLRGEFDGDGCWYLANSRGKLYLRNSIVSGSPAFRHWLFDSIHRLAYIQGGHLFHNALWFATRDSERLGEFMYYEDALPYLTRKRQIWADWMKRQLHWKASKRATIRPFLLYLSD